MYIALQNPDISWLCDHCGMPNFSSGLFVPSISESQNSFAALSDTNVNTSSSAMDLGSDVHASSPNTQRPPTRKGTPLLKVLSLNCNSVKGKDKNCEFRVLIDQHDPQVILGCESKIDSTLSTYSLFPDHYTEVYRRDRTRAGEPGEEYSVPSGNMSLHQRRGISTGKMSASVPEALSRFLLWTTPRSS